MRRINYVFVLTVYVLPILILNYYVEFRLFMVLSIWWVGFLFFRGVHKKPDGLKIEFEITTEDNV
ncbi:hypothetical protein [Streptococcus sp. CSL10205-OR2]|uniref:hypothetical protein n=1 Tax=Streptococcus sp. CSL10205-OR2 TaxID=2980558 RepID=UPI0021D97391|nr:hypothetical protein [Streptococcus sp. CSL10205-OR2]MCU9533526.1 hypothetical protein [Streptococcus sp. CSL10205-OR2]